MASDNRLVIVVAAYFPDSYGGAERQASILASALARRGVDVTIIAPSVRKDTLAQEPTDFGRIVRKHLRAYPNLGGRHIGSFLAWTRWLPKEIRTRNLDGVPIYVFHARLHALGPALAAKRSGAPLLMKLGGGGDASEFDALRSKKYIYGKMVERFLKRRVDLFVANSRQIAADLQSAGVRPDQIVEFPNGVLLPPSEALRFAERGRNGRRFIYIGRLLADKNVDILFEAARTLVGCGEALELTMVGDGPEKERLVQILSADAARRAIRLPGFIDDVYTELLTSDFFVSASRREGQSNALLEAMSAGVIPIVYAASGVAEVVVNGVNGFIIEQSTTLAFEDAMRRALEMTETERRAMSAAARAFAVAHVGIDAIATKTLDAIAVCSARREVA